MNLVSGDHREGDRASPASPPRPRPGPEVTLDLALCGVLIAGLPLLAQHLLASLAPRTVALGMVGGGLCIVWSVLGARGSRFRGGAMMTLAAVACGFIVQAVESWWAAGALGAMGRAPAVLMAVLSVFCIGTLANVAAKAKPTRV